MTDANQGQQAPPEKTPEELAAEKKAADQEKKEQQRKDDLAAIVSERGKELLALGYSKVEGENLYQFGPEDQESLDYHEVTEEELQDEPKLWVKTLALAKKEAERIRQEEIEYKERQAQEEKEAQAEKEKEALHQEREKTYGPGYVVARRGVHTDVFSAITWRMLSVKPDGSRDGWKQEVVTPPEVLALKKPKSNG